MQLRQPCIKFGFLLLILAACQPTDSPDGVKVVAGAEQATVIDEPQRPLPDGPDSSWVDFVNRYIEDFLAAHPAFAVAQGRHEFDGLLPDWSAEGIAREISRLRQAREDALAFSASELGATGQYQRKYLLATIDRALFWLEKAEWPFVNPTFYFDRMMDSLDPRPYIALNYASLEERMNSYTRYARNIPRATDQIRSNLRMPMARTRLEYGIDSFGGLADYFMDEVPAVFAAVGNEALQAEFAEANTAAAVAMRELAEWLKSNRNSATGDYALGPDLFRQMIYDTERVNVSLEELEAIGLADMKRNQLALGEVCAEFAPGESIRSCFSSMANRKPDGGAVAAARLQREETKAFLIEQDLLSNAGEEEALVAGEFGRVFVTCAFAEGWAHYAEEIMLEAGLRGGSPEARVGQLSKALLRNAHFLSAIGLHTRGMSVEEAGKLFMEEAYLDRGTAEQQAARGTYDPAFLNYTLGKLMIRQLRDDWTARAGGRAAWKEFHDTFLSFGGPPIPLARAQMMNGNPEAVFSVSE